MNENAAEPSDVSAGLAAVGDAPRQPPAQHDAASVAAAIHDATLEHRLRPGTRLPEVGLAEHFGVSRAVVRSALSCLAQKGLVSMRPYRGCIVACPTVAETRDVFAARRIIEAAVLEAIPLPLAAAELQALRARVAAEQEALDSRDRNRAVRLSGEFHLALARLQPNSVLLDYVTDLVSRTSLIVALYEAPGAPGCRCREHGTLIDKIEAGQVDAARSIMLQHLDAIEANLRLDSSDEEIDFATVFGGDQS